MCSLIETKEEDGLRHVRRGEGRTGAVQADRKELEGRWTAGKNENINNLLLVTSKYLASYFY